MVGDIYIIGQIGTFDGVKGKELAEVVQEYEKIKNYSRVNVHINSCGGLVEVGYAIANYFANFDNIYTIAENECMSIATVVLTSVPVEKRAVVKGTKFMVHAPWGTISGSSSELNLAAEELKDLEDKLIDTYVKATVTSKAGVEAIVRQETYLNEKQVIDYGFASKIISATKSKAVAFVDKSNKNEKLMSTFKEKMKAMLTFAKANGLDVKDLEKEIDGGRNAVAMKIPTDKGELTTEYDDVLEGDAVTIDEKVPEDGDYTTPDGDIFTIVGGKVTKIVWAEENNSEEMASLKTKNTELEAELATLKAKNTELENESKQALALMDKLSSMKSTHTPDTRAWKGKGTSTTTNASSSAGSYKDRMKERAENKKK